MSCLLTCFYLQLGLAAMGTHPAAPGQTFWLYDINRVENPYGTAELGWSIPYGKWSFELAARHVSSIAVDIHARSFDAQWGTNTVEVRVRWQPWRQH
jgi:hypothetical protein